MYMLVRQAHIPGGMVNVLVLREKMLSLETEDEIVFIFFSQI